MKKAAIPDEKGCARRKMRSMSSPGPQAPSSSPFGLCNMVPYPTLRGYIGGIIGDIIGVVILLLLRRLMMMGKILILEKSGGRIL